MPEPERRMPVELNHTIVHATDSRASATWLAAILALDPPTPFGPFQVVELDNGVSLDFIDAGGHPIDPIHYAFLVTEEEFDQIFGRIQDQGLEFWADPARQQPGVINHHFGGRGVYFPDPDGHFLEIITQPYAIHA